MFFYQRKPLFQKRVIRIRDEWGELHTLEFWVSKKEPTDKELQEQLETTVLIRRIDE